MKTQPLMIDCNKESKKMLKLSKCDHGVKTTTLENWQIDKREFLKHFLKPKVGTKDGSYFLMGYCDGRRSAKNIKEANLIILDCDSQYNNDLEVIDGAPAVSAAIKMLKKNKLSYLLYTTFSHKLERQRYRIVFFPDCPIKPNDISKIVRFMITHFNAASVPIAYTTESSQISQPWFFPRVKDEQARANYVSDYNINGNDLPVEKVLKAYQDSDSGKPKDFRDSLEDEASKEIEQYSTGQWSIMGLFLEVNNNLAFMRGILTKHGYEEKYRTYKELRYLAPGSTSGQPGVSLFKGDNGKWRVTSYHNPEHDRLAIPDKDDKKARLALDAFDVWTQLEYEGDQKKAIEKEKQEHKDRLLDHFIKRFVYRAKSNMAGDTYTGKSYPYNPHFTNFTASAFWTEIGSKGGVKKIQVSEAWKSSFKRVTATDDGWLISDDRTYLNHDDKDIKGKPQLYWNDYVEPKWDEVKTEEHLPTFIEHIKYLIPNEEDCELFIQWLAERFQYPLDRARFTPLHISPNQGTGRGWIVRLMQELMGADNTSTTKMSELAGKGNEGKEYLMNKRFCAVHEVYEERKYKYQIDAKVRSTLTESYLHINTKYGFKGQMRVYTSLFLMSNHRDCLVLPPEDRRIWVIEGRVIQKSAEYYNKLYGMLNNKQFLREVYWYLKRLDITKIRELSRAPDNDAKARLVGTGASDTEARFRMMLKDPPGLVWTNNLLQVYINVLAGQTDPAFIDTASMEVRALCRSALTEAYKGLPIRITDPTLKLAGRGTLRLKAHPAFPEKHLNNAEILKRELKKTVNAVRMLIDGETLESIVEGFKEAVD